MLRTKFIGSLALAAMSFATPAVAAPATDCPLRDAPFSIASPLIDILLNAQAKDIVDREIPGGLSKMPPVFVGTEPPTFAAILTPREAGRFIRIEEGKMAAIDAELRALPVTDADKLARCARYDNDPLAVSLPPGKPRVLLFEKINGFRDGPSVEAAHAAVLAMAQRKGWTLVTTDRGGAFTPATLGQFDVVLWNNISGDVLSLAQRAAFKDYIERGGAFVGVHGTAGDPVYFWDWYADTLIGARFAGHPIAPQFQDARIFVEGKAQPAARRLPAEWVMNDEWYSFKSNPRAAGATVIARLDESTYKPDGMMGQDLRMGADHPLAWSKCIGKGRMFYSAIGHRPETYSDPRYVAMLEDAIAWAAAKGDCVPGKIAAKK